MLDALCLDLMGVVLYDPYIEALWAATGMDPETVELHRSHGVWPAFESAEIDEATFARRFFSDPNAGHRFDLDAFHRARRSGYRFLPGIPELLDAVAGRLARYVASNYPVWIEEVRDTFALDQRFEGIFASHHLRVRKPAPEFFERLLAHTGHRAQDCLFVDDRVENCDAAESVGMRAHLFAGADDLARRLAAEGVVIGAR